jgi:glycosyltransferase involved in cell wall biosynthesis
VTEAPIRVLALSPIPEEGAGCRFRIAQFIPYLESAGFQVTLQSLFTTEFFRLVYKPGQHLRKAVTLGGLSLRRLATLASASQYDVIFLYREIFPLGPPIVEKWLASRRRPPIVFDFDDAIFLPSVSDANRLIATLKQPSKVRTIIQRSDRVIVGNDYLAAYARQYSSAVTIIPTSVDLGRFVPRQPASGDVSPNPLPVIGWIGSPTTGSYLQMLGPVFQKVAERHRFVVRISGTADPVTIPGVQVDNRPWRLDREVELFNTCDIGVYPLPDDDWSKGKCGFKAIQFMACGVPVLSAAVGVNREIIQDGVNGYLASSQDEWIAKLERLLGDAGLRRRFAEAGRRTIAERYSLEVNAPKMAAVLRAAAQESKSR